MEKINLEAKVNDRDICMFELYEPKEVAGRNILWAVVHEDFFTDAPNAVEQMREGETVKFTLTCDIK